MRVNKKALSLFTLEDLREEAENRGYTLVKKRKRLEPIPCNCGGKAISWVVYGEHQIECSKCHRTSNLHSKYRDAVVEWNSMIQKEGVSDDSLC